MTTADAASDENPYYNEDICVLMSAHIKIDHSKERSSGADCLVLTATVTTFAVSVMTKQSIISFQITRRISLW